MAINKRQKGNRVQLKAIEQLEAEGWLVNKVEVGGKWEKSKDLYGLWDILCLSRYEILFVQITCNQPHNHKDYIEFSKKYSAANYKYQQWVWYDRKGWVKYVYYQGRQLKFDERKGAVQSNKDNAKRFNRSN